MTSVSDVVALVALVAAIALGIPSLLAMYISERISRLEKAMEHTKCEDFFLSNVAEHSVKSSLLLDNMIVIQNLIISRLIETCKLPQEMADEYSKVFKESRRDLNKTLQTLLIYSSRNEWRQSAFKQLSENLGEADTLRAFIELQRYETELLTDLNRAVTDLEGRLIPERGSGAAGTPL